MGNNLGNKQTLAKNLKYYMDKSGIDRNKLCADLNFSYTTVCGWLTAEKYPRIDKIERLANYFGIQKSDLIEDSPAPAISPDDIKAAFWGGDKDLSKEDLDAMWADVKNFADFVAQKKKQEKQRHD